ncbi:MAG TPA: cysteine--tRNA ligase [Terriglobales bacterium]|nr:cysteine--tRNA ligase [Terriglobales bacterium]
MPLRLFNTLSGKVEEFTPAADNTARMYSCGPTVYDFAHIGNFRTFVAIDLLRRALRQHGYKLQHVMNITDVDDRIIENARKLGVSVNDYTRKFEQAFFEDAAYLNLEKPEVVSRATEHIEDMAKLIARLEQKGVAYKADDGSYYYRVAKFPQYGKLSKKDLAHIEDGARVDSDRFDKEEARDFALWKAPKEGEAFWETSIGKGRPGWHIECSAMAMRYLGETLDLHAGGEDLMFPHHENEIAQSEAATGKLFARHWMHVRFLLIEQDKMSKSLGNFHTLRDLILKGHKPSTIRLLLTSVPYRKQLNFTEDGLRSMASGVERLRNFKLRLDTGKFEPGSNKKMADLADYTVKSMREALADDLNTAAALAAIFDLVRDANAAADRGDVKKDDVPALLGALQKFDEVFDVLRDDDAAKVRAVQEWAKAQGKEVAAAGPKLSDAEVDALIAERQAARKEKNFRRSDEIRDQLAAAGIVVEDTKDGMRWKRK